VRALGLALLALAATAAPAAARPAAEVDAQGRLRVVDGGRTLLAESHALRLGFRSAGTWHSATGVVARRGALVELATDDPGGRTLALHLGAGGRAGLRAAVRGGGPPVQGLRVGFATRRGERYLGFGERSNAVDQRGREVQNYVQEGPYQPAEYPVVDATVPDWALFARADATPFPMPWLLSTGGWGVLLTNPEESRFRLGSQRRDTWSAEVDAPELRLRVFAGTPAALVRRLTRVTGRQPPPAAPWLLGPWFQTGHQNTAPDEADHVRRLRAGDAPVSVAETHMRYMPCGADQGQEAAERARTAGFHRQGLAVLTYQREAVCREYASAFARGVFLRRPDGSTYTFDAFVGGAVKPLAMIDFGAAGADAFHASLLARATANGYDGWMEDYGEYVPPDAVSATGTPPAQLHNLYPVRYHRSGMRFARASPRPLVRFVRSGWTGVHPHAQVVWGGDPTTGWGFDGLRSSLTQALTMGLSGISLWGSDIGGFFTLSEEHLTPELLARWIQFGAVSGVMRTKAEGIGADQALRPQIWQPRMLGHWRRWAKLRTQLYPYLVAADREYRRTGLPLMRHLALAYPRDRRALATDDAFLFGPDLLAAPVLEPGARRRRLYLPRGRWVDLWRSARFSERRGGLALRRVRLLRGGRRVTVPAPLGELPLLARAGTLLALLAPEVDTLADYGSKAPGVVRLRDRRGIVELLAFPRGRSSARFGEHGRLRSRERPGGWVLRVAAGGRRTIRLQAALGSLRRPFVPGAVLKGGRPLAHWRYDRRSRVLRLRFRAGRVRLLVKP
jgi:alpha-glucosidase (family GH31 glycosyl hydrolase)